MAKYYFRCDDYKTILSASSSFKACLLGLKKIILQNEDGIEIDYDGQIKVSEKGYMEHDGDYTMNTSTALGFLYWMYSDGEQGEEKLSSDDEQ